ncbi:unnamed protein product [Coregonus sp. 'balchen']|nr:unnamed protein product [Coregonus sp. 'balchen']
MISFALKRQLNPCVRLASSRFLTLRFLSCSASLLCQGHPAPGRGEDQQRLSLKALANAPKHALYLGLSRPPSIPGCPPADGCDPVLPP